MRVLVAPDSFKESMDAVTAANAIIDGIKKVAPQASCKALPVADGGEGLVEVLAGPMGAKTEHVLVSGPLGKKVLARFGWVEKTRTGIVEVAEACGMHLVDANSRDIWRSSTEGVGEILLHLRSRGAKTIVIGLGGSVTNDGGSGMIRALGASLRDNAGEEVLPGPVGLKEISSLDISGVGDWSDIDIVLASDVSNPLLGVNGASAVFGPQKGASKTDVLELDATLAKWLAVGIRAHTKSVDIGVLPGGGAAGGLGAALVAFLDARISPGINLVLDLIGFHDEVMKADLVVTGEGKLDNQTSSGKAPWGVCQAANAHGVPTIAFCGVAGDGAGNLIGLAGFREIVEISDPEIPHAKKLRDGPRNISMAAEKTIGSLIRDLDVREIRC